ncbi:MAG TPA: serine hydrolase domain-containing protein [Thermoanaerobaculia bacterium]
MRTALALFLLWVSTGAAAPEPTIRAEALVADAAKGYPGMRAVVVGASGRLFASSQGLADVEAKRPVESSTRFRIYSAVKPMTAAAALRLAREGKLDLDAPIGRYLSGLPPALAPITARQLATHTSGIRHYNKGEAVTTSPCRRVSDALPAFQNDPLLFPPGRREAYSSYGYVLLSAVVEAASGQPFEQSMRRLVFEPAGMTETELDDSSRSIPQRAHPYETGPDGGWMDYPADPTCKWGAGGFLSTADDMARFGRALIEGKIVPKQDLPSLWTPARTAEGTSDFGLGWSTAGTDGGRLVAVQSGGNVGGRSVLVLDPDSGIVVAMTANLEGPRMIAPAKELVDLFAGARAKD